MKLKLVNLFILFVFVLAGCQELPPPYNDNETVLRNSDSEKTTTLMIFKDWDKMDKRSYLRLKNTISIFIQKEVDSLPPWLDEYENFTSFNMINNKQIVELPTTFYKIKSLEMILIFDSKLAEIDSSINKLKQLEQILLYDNQIKTFPEEIYALPHLKEVDFSGNPLENPEEIRRRFEEKGVKVTL